MASEEGVVAAAERRSFWFTLRQLLVVMVGWAVGLALVGCGEASRRTQCSNHLKQIEIAMRNYYDVFGSFPPSYIAAANGKPMHSWRVLIRTFCEGRAVADPYDFNEPWDGPNNRKLASEIPIWLHCPARPKGQPAEETDYVVVVGPQTMWPGSKAIQLSDLTDRSSNTILVVEVHNSGIHWMEPRDLDVKQMAMGINPVKGRGISSPHVGCALAVFADGHTQALPSDLAAETLRALLTRAGGEKIPEF